MMAQIHEELGVYTERQLAEYFEVRLATVRYWRKMDRITPTHWTPGNKPLYSRAYIQDVIERGGPHNRFANSLRAI